MELRGVLSEYFFSIEDVDSVCKRSRGLAGKEMITGEVSVRVVVAAMWIIFDRGLLEEMGEDWNLSKGIFWIVVYCWEEMMGICRI